MSTLKIQIGKDIIEGKLVESNKWQFWLDSKKFSIHSSEGIQDAIEMILNESIILQGKQNSPNIWTTEHSFYGSSAWGSVFIQYTFQFNTESMTVFVETKSDVSA
jgi:hypothetical protein